MKACRCCLLAMVLCWAGVPAVWAGGSGLNVVVVVNQNSADSIELGNYYSEKRHVPPENVLRINWNGGIAAWNNADFNNFLLNPLFAMIADRQLTQQIDYVVLSMDIPYRVVQGGGVTTAGDNSTTAIIYYGFKPDGPGAPEGYPSCNLPDVSSNSYAGSEAIFRDSPPLSALTNSYLTMMITSSNLAQAKAIVDRGVLSDASFPIQPVVLAKSFDTFRNVRYSAFDNTIFNTRLISDYPMYRTNSGSPYGVTNLLGYETGLDLFSILPNTFVPGAIADSLTSTAGVLYEPNNQTTLLAFLDAGATASYGT
ncbi:MAG: TIGR03790 family protein, partial [Limisphaerales bacterium]